MNEENSVENRICVVMSKVLCTSYNWSLLVLTAVLWIIISMVPYLTNQNFNMQVIVNEYVRIIAVAAIIIGFIGEKDNRILIGLGVSSFVMSLLSVVMIQSLLASELKLGYILFMPINIFLFLLVLKNVWMGSLKKDDDNK